MSNQKVILVECVLIRARKNLSTSLDKGLGRGVRVNAQRRMEEGKKKDEERHSLEMVRTYYCIWHSHSIFRVAFVALEKMGWLMNLKLYFISLNLALWDPPGRNIRIMLMPPGASV